MFTADQITTSKTLQILDTRCLVQEYQNSHLEHSPCDITWTLPFIHLSVLLTSRIRRSVCQSPTLHILLLAREVSIHLGQMFSMLVQDFEKIVKAEAHQEALNTGENPASLAAGTRNVTANSTIAAVTGIGLSEGAAQASEADDLDVQSEDLDWDDELASMELEEEEEEERAYEQELKVVC